MLSMMLASSVIAGGVELGTLEVAEAEAEAEAAVQQPVRDPERREWDAPARRQFGPMAGDWEFTISGGGISDHRFRNHNYQLNASLGHFLTDEFLIGFRQTVNFSELGGDSVLRGTSRGVVQWNFNFDAFRPFVGGNVGWTYGDGGDGGLAGPEAGVKFFVSERTFLFGMAEYNWFWQNLRDADDRRRRGEFVFTVGIGLLW